MRGIYPPGRCSPPFGNCKTGNSDVEPLIALHNMLLSHAKAVDLYRKHFQVTIKCPKLAFVVTFSRLGETGLKANIGV